MGIPQVSRVSMSSQNLSVVYVDFADGISMVFIEHFVPMVTTPPRLEAVWLKRDTEQLVSFHSPHQYPANRSPLGFAYMADGWTPQRFADYWQAAVDHVCAAHEKGKLKRAWFTIVMCTRSDLDEIKSGRWTA